MNGKPGLETLALIADWVAIEAAIREGKTAKGIDLEFTNAHKQDLMKALNERKKEVQKVATA